MHDTKTIVVGTDGSDSSIHALRWALSEARLRGASVEVIHSWHLAYYPDMFGLASFPGEAMRSSAEAVLADVLSAVAEDVGPIAITGRVEPGPASTALVNASEQAELLVVGRRGHGGFLTLVIGSVAQQVAAHAKCPVVIVDPE
jgi:nucleotide-binding universal stress UspA family protein